MKIYNPQNQYGQRFITAQDYDIHFRGNITLSPNTFLYDGSSLTVVLDAKAEKTTLNDLTVQVQSLNESKADKVSVDAISTQVQGLYEQKADKTSLNAVDARVQIVETGKADKTELEELKNDLNYEMTIEPTGGTVGNAAYKYAKINKMFFPLSGKIKTVSIKSRSGGTKSSGFYLMIFQQQKDSTNPDASTWEFKGISKNAPEQTAYDTFYDFEFENVEVAQNQHIALLVTTNPNQTTWIYPSTMCNCRTKARVAPDDFSCMGGTSEIAHFPFLKYTIAAKCTEKIQEMCVGGGAVTKSQLAASMDDNDKLPTAQMVKDYVDSLISNQ